MYLDKMRKEKKTLRFLAAKPKDLAHRIRQAFAAAEEFSEYNHYVSLRRDYIIRAQEDAVLAEYIALTPVVEEPMKKLAEKLESSAITLAEIIAAIIQQRKNTDTLVFPSADLKTEEKNILSDWAEEQGLNMIDADEEGITLTSQPVLDFLIYKKSE